MNSKFDRVKNVLKAGIILCIALIPNTGICKNAPMMHRNVPQEAPIIFNCNETVVAGEAFGLQGHHFGENPELWMALVNGTETTLKPERKLDILSKSDINISALIPADTNIRAGNLIAVWVKNGSTLSKPVFLNKARAISLEFDEIMPGQPFRIFGRNLKVDGAEPVIRFEAPNQKPLLATYVTGETYIIHVIAPKDIKPGLHYKIAISNGNGLKWGESIAPATMFARPSAVDPFGLKVAWGTDFTFYKNIYNVKTDTRLTIKAVGDGRANDRNAIQKAIDMANKDGGGVVYLPAGTYKLEFASGCGLIMKSKVVISGDGYTNTNIQYGFGTPPPYDHPIGKSGWPDSTTNGVAMLWPLGTTLSGLYGLRLQNVNTSGIWKHSIKNMPPPEKKPGAGGSKFFVSNCRFDFAVAWGLSWGHVDRFMITDCEFESHAVNTWPWQWHCNGATNFIVRNNTMRYSAGRFGFNDSYSGIIENNHIIRFGDEQRPPGETGGFNIDYASEIMVLKNYMGVIGKSIINSNQGETILSQGCNPENQDAGHVSSASYTTIVDESNKWHVAIRNPSLNSSDAVAIVAGRGAGQWRSIVSNTTNTIKVDRPWDVIPDKGSYYVVMRWSAKGWLVKDNILEDNNHGIEFYCGNNDVVIADNLLTNSDGIYLRSDQRITGPEHGRFNLGWNTVIEGNQVINNNGLRPAYIYSILALGVPYDLHGIGTLGQEIRHNYVEAHQPNSKSLVPGEGYWNSVESRNGVSTSQVGILGTIFESNKVVNSEIGYHLSSNVSQTIIKDPVYRNVKIQNTDSIYPNRKSEGTVVVAACNNIANDPFCAYLTGIAPKIVKDLGEDIDSIKVRKVVFYSRDVELNGQNVATNIFAVIARPLQPGNYPGILVLHGGGGTAEIDKARRWAAKGYIAVAIDIPGIVPPDKVPNSSGVFKTYKYGERRFPVSPGITGSTIFDAALASLQGFYLLQSQPDVIKERLGITGVSWGGYMTTMVSGLLCDDIQAAFSTYGSGFYDEGSAFLKELNKMPLTERDAWLKYLDAGRRSKNISAPYFVAAATNDIYFYPPAVLATLHAINSPVNHLFAPNVSHAAPVPGGNLTNDRVSWMQMELPYFEYYLKDKGLPLPKVSINKILGAPEHDNYMVKFFVDSKTPITDANIYYSMANPLWPKRNWVKVKAVALKNGWYEAPLPASVVGKGTMCFASVSDARPVTVSSDLTEYY